MKTDVQRGLTLLILLILIIFIQQNISFYPSLKAALGDQDIYRDRRNWMKKMCLEHREELELRYKIAWPHLNYETVLQESLIMIEKSHPFIWCLRPKAASSSLTSVFGTHWFGANEKGAADDNYASLNTRNTEIVNNWFHYNNTSALQKKNFSEHSFNFMITRHPFESLLSAYRDKFFLSNESDLHNKQQVEWYLNQIGKLIIQKYRKSPPSDQIYQQVPTFREFVEYIVDIPWNQFDGHWIPAYLQCMPCHIQYSFLGKVDTINTDSNNLFKELKMNYTLPHFHANNENKSESSIKSYYSTLDKKLLQQLIHVYKPDFYLFDYSYNQYMDLIDN